ncbi:fibronectin type III domain-containing protein [Streptomonospora nanhaiensis]|uniref:fibronectin type III domain-containing protein n=1 Tax=Streptomonospora nanhaiensis TaxID=1323731 RepID=UPI001C9A19E3|nr:fibronectin type III domain-containing protein [Streptomonospora nanhaiensis]MBX9388437.1 fibronectin type III domain-containing protein [Streptomonospora nanhaiensis]
MVDQPTGPAANPPSPAPSPSGRFDLRGGIAALGRRTRSGAAGLTIVVLAAALISTAFGLGAMGRADEMSDGAAWLWNSPAGELARVNGNNAEVDLVTSLPDSKGGAVEVSQNDEYLLLHDPSTGKVTSVDLREMGFSGVLDLGRSGDFGVVLGKESAVVIDRLGGEIKAVDPATLQPTGASLEIPAPLVGGAFDDSDTLWLGVPSQGTAVGVRVEGKDAAIAETVSVADPGADLALTVLDEGALAVDRGGDRIVPVNGEGEARVLDAPVKLKDAEVPPRTRGDLAAITVPGKGRVVTVSDAAGAAEVASFATGGEGAGAAVAYEGRVYVPFAADGRVRVFQPDGTELNPISLPGAKGPIELEAREGHLFINSPDTGVAAVVDPSGQANLVDKTDPPPGDGEGPGAGAPASGTPEPSAPPQTQPPGGAPSTQAPPAPGTGESQTPRPGPQDEEPQEPSNPPPADNDGDGEGGGGEGDGETEEPESTDAPGAPTPVSATAGDGSVTLSWPAAYSPDAPVETYEITWEGGSRTVDGSELSAEITDLRNGTAYRFRVRAANRYGTGPAAQTQEVTPGPEAPGAPANVTAEATGGDTATVSWDAVEGAVDYQVTASSSSGSAVPAPRTTGSASAEITGLEPGGSYTFTVVARGEGGVSGEPSSSQEITMPEEELGAPASVTWQASGDTVTVSWDAVEGAAEYRVTPGGDGAAALQEATATGTSHTYQPRGAGRCYSFTVTALGADGTAAESGTTSQASCVREFN